MDENAGRIDWVDIIEAAINEALHEHILHPPGAQASAVQAALQQSLRLISPEHREKVLRRVVSRNPGWASSPDDSAGKPVELGTTERRPTDRSRQAAWDRQKRDLQAQASELEANLAHATEESERLLKDLEKRAQAHRQLQKRYSQDQQKLTAILVENENLASTAQSLRTQVDKIQKQNRQLNQQVIRLDTELKTTQALHTEPARAPERPEPESPPEAPPEPEIVVTSAAYESFCAALSAENKLTAEEVPPASEERDRRLGHLAATLVLLLEGVEGTVVSHFEKLIRQQPILAEPLENLRFFQKTDRTWWWTLTGRGSRKVVPERRFARYVDHLNKLNYILLAAYSKIAARVVGERAKELMNPGAIRRRSEVTRSDELWEFYESRACFEIPKMLADDCQAELAKLIDELYRFGTDVD